MTARTSLTPGVQRRQLDELPLGGQRDDVRERGLAGAGRAVEHQRHRLVGLDQPAQRRPRRRAGAAGRRPRRARAAACGRRAARPGRPPPPPPPRQGRRTANSRLRRYPRDTTVSRAAATHRQRHRRPVTVGAIGLGAMPLSTKEPRPSPADAEATVHAALDAGVTLIDTADAYSRDEAEFGHNEELVANALRSYGRHRRPRGDQGRAHPARLGLGPRRLARLPAAGLRGLAAPAGRRRDRAVPVPPARPRDAVGGVDGRAALAVRRRAGADGRHLQRGHRADRRGPGDLRRRAGQRAEPVLPRLALLGRRAGALRGARARVAAVEPVRRGAAPPARWTPPRRRSRRWPTSSASRSTG